VKQRRAQAEDDAQQDDADKKPKEFHNRYYRAVPFRIAVGRRVFSPSWLMTVITLLLLVLFISLGRWQWGRAEFKQQLGAEFAASYGRIVTLGSSATIALPRYTRIDVGGTWDGSRQFLLDNRTRDGRAGYEVLTPLQLADGRWLMVNRGWVPFEGYRDRLPEVRLTSAEETVRVSGLLDELPVAGLAGGRAAPALSGNWPRVTAYPQPAELARSLGVDSKRLESRVLLLDASAPDGYRRDWKPYAKGPEQNWSYAIQWWSFAVLLLVLFVIMNLKKRDTE
jgi:surfeit locus 1 family protein